MKTSIPSVLITLALVCFSLLPKAQAVVPPPDGGYPNFNTAEGTKALQSLTTGSANTAVGWLSLFSTATGSFNTATGAGALLSNTADENTAFGAAALLFNTTGANNTAVGAAALQNNTGEENTATGHRALFSNTTGSLNTADGAGALYFNSTGAGNTATGFQALLINTTGSQNTAIGSQALFTNTEGDFNTASGAGALFTNTEGDFNTAIGVGALRSNTTGLTNTAIGHSALDSNTTGALNTALGNGAGINVITANDVICINHPGEDVSNTTWIGNIYNTTTVNAITLPVVVSNGNQLGTMSSSARFKKEIKAMDKTSESILALKPVTFHYKSDKKNTAQFGLIAEDVAKVNTDLVVRDENGEIYTVRYDVVNAMLLNEFLKEHGRNEEQQSKIEEQEARIVQQRKEIDALTAGLQKVSAQLEVNKPAPQTVLNNQ